jgi:hypothetical protein
VARAFIKLAAMAALVALFSPQGAAARARPWVGSVRYADGPYPVRAFQLAASNGYSLAIFGIPASMGSGARVVVQAWNSFSVSSYVGPGRVTDKGMWARLGRFGTVAVRFVRSGARKFASPCGRETRELVTGSYVGRFEFHGEEGFSEASEPNLEAEPLYRDPWECSSSERTFGGEVPGVVLQVLSRYGEFQAIENRPGDPVRFMASSGTKYGRVQVSRFVEVFGRAGGFEWDRDLTHAQLALPAPFPVPPHTGTSADVPPGGKGTFASISPAFASIR